MVQASRSFWAETGEMALTGVGPMISKDLHRWIRRDSALGKVVFLVSAPE